MTDKDSVTVVPISNPEEFGDNWQPIVGEETNNVVSILDADRRAPVIDAAVSILGRGANPQTLESCKTGLVVGYVQSGKTLSFTTVMALARDNGYRLIVAVTGTSTLLLKQSDDRLKEGLDTEARDKYPKWRRFNNPTINNKQEIGQAFEEWDELLVPTDEKQTVLITVMKHYTHLSNLVKLVRNLNLKKIPTLIVDDEADQASLNTLIKKGQKSATYKNLTELKEMIPCHTFLQYTATPQAPLLISIDDTLSPDFVEVLVPGDDYTGGKYFFNRDDEADTENNHIKIISDNDVPTDDDFSSEPPESLKRALQVFFVGVASGRIQGDDKQNDKKRSMLVHPSQKTAMHSDYWSWINHTVKSWKEVLKLENDDPDRIDFIEDFRTSYSDVNSTVEKLPPFEKIIEELPTMLGRTGIEKINSESGSTPVVDWSRRYSWILVGGQSLGRGFTVEGLTVTYMPRDIGVGNADTIQQRGRFFGYKSSYFGYCRVFLGQDMYEAFKDYVEHEESLRQQLRQIRDKNQPLKEWKRKFFLAHNLQLCRQEVIVQNMVRSVFGESWFSTRNYAPAASINKEITESFLSGLDLRQDDGHPDREKVHKHKFCHARLNDVVEKLLSRFQFSNQAEANKMYGILFLLNYALEKNQDEECSLYQISPDYRRERTVDSTGKIPNLFQGQNVATSRYNKGEVYKGDGKILDSENVTIQIHSIDIKRENSIDPIDTSVPFIAIRIPKRMQTSWIEQE